MLYWTLTLIGVPIVRLLLRPTVLGRQHLPRRGGVILVSNHLSYVDSVLLPIVLRRRRLHFLAASEYFAGRGFGARVRRHFLLSTGMVPIDRSGGAASSSAVQSALRLVAEGRVVVIYPEGSRSRDGLLHRGHTGAARLARDSGAVVVPVGLRGTDQVIGTGTGARFRLAPVRIAVGEPLDLGVAPDASNRENLRSITERIMSAIREQSGQEYVDTYARRHASGGTAA